MAESHRGAAPHHPVLLYHALPPRSSWRVDKYDVVPFLTEADMAPALQALHELALNGLATYTDGHTGRFFGLYRYRTADTQFVPGVTRAAPVLPGDRLYVCVTNPYEPAVLYRVVLDAAAAAAYAAEGAGFYPAPESMSVGLPLASLSGCASLLSAVFDAVTLAQI